MKAIKSLAIMFVASLLVLNLVIACGGMSPQPAPGDFDTQVPSLPDDSTDSNDDANTDSHDCPFPADLATEEDDAEGDNDSSDNNDDNVDSLPTDLPTPDATNQTKDGQFVDVIL